MLKAILLLCLLTPSLSFSQIIRKINGVEITREELPFNLNGNLKAAFGNREQGTSSIPQ